MNGVPTGGASYWSNAGYAAALLDAILVDGFGLVTLDSVSVTNNVATATRTSGITFLLNQVIEIAGATPSALNGQWRVASIDQGSKTFTFATTGISDQTATGTITCKTPSLDWERVYSSGNKRVYRSKNELSPRSYYRFDDSSTSVKGAAMTAYESMTDIDTGYNQWINAAAVSNGYVGFPRWTDGAWAAYGDDRTFYMIGQFRTSTVYPALMFAMGDYTSIKPGDQKNEFAAHLHCAADGVTVYGKTLWSWQSTYDTTHMPYYASLHDDSYGNLGHVPVVARTHNDASGYQGPTFPSVADHGMFVTEHWLQERSSGTPIRGKMRGSYWVLANQPLNPSYPPTFIQGVIGLEGKLCGLCARQDYLNSNWQWGRVLFDLTGPWE
jgi:hypothetical protein